MTTAPEPSPVPWPDADAIVLANRPLRPSTDRSTLSRYADPVWYLLPAQLDDQAAPVSEKWTRICPPFMLRETFKVFAWTALNSNWPHRLQRPLVDEQPGILTVHKWLMNCTAFANWLEGQGIHRFCDVSSRDLKLFKSHVLELARPDDNKVKILHAARVLWGYRDLLPEECRLPKKRPWGAASAEDLVGVVHDWYSSNKTPRLAAVTMEALLAWSLRMIEDFGPDIREALHAYEELMGGQHPATLAAKATYGATSLRARFPGYLAELHQAGRGLPGCIRRQRHGGGIGLDHAHIARMVGSSTTKVKPHEAAILTMAKEYGLQLEDDAYALGDPVGRFQGTVWRDRPIGIREAYVLVRHLTAACFIVICYLSGMRSGEVLQLRRGCLRQDNDGALVLIGRRSKGPGRFPAADIDETEERPWAVVSAVSPAVEMLESLSDTEMLFPPSRQRTTTVRTRRNMSKPSGTMNDDLRSFIDWVNSNFSDPSGPAIPPDPIKEIHARRFRRTLAYFVVRRPGGLVAAQLQYGHINVKVTLGYAGDADTAWMEDLAVEELEMVVEQVDEDLLALDGGEQVSGPSAPEYRRRVHKAAKFAGRVLNQARNAGRLLASVNPNIHHGLGMTCVWRYETAGCREEREAAGVEVGGPDERFCRTDCTNLAFTDRDIEHKRVEYRRWNASAEDALSPKPLRDRARVKAERARAVVVGHERSGADAAGQGRGDR
ncbi:hypothetical protein [Streptomyces sp. NBC_00347]|uniref:hypothetical protein n=1 Tax=Streptomyces sp. NBC_00347 TaxID=2975721 RepID=UPI0022548BC4|nr:hypothetical protein [Streptomyces sp. NBC_00347]MCX5129430.1 hypothetical protein [Streptomyces sp. NBC_00347]